MRFLCHGLILIYTSVLADVAPDNLDYSNFLADASDSLGSDVWTPDSDVYNPNLEIATPFEGTGAKPALDPTGDDTISDMFASEITGSDLDGNIADAGNGCSSQSKQSFGKLRAREICVNPNAKERITEDAISEEKRFCQVDQVPGCCLPSEMFQGLWWSFMQGPCQDYNPFNPICKEPNVYCCSRIWFDSPKEPDAMGLGINCINALVFF